MHVFKEDFGVFSAENNEKIIPSGDQSLYASIVQVGEVVGSLSAGFIGDKSGRKGAMLAAIILAAFGTL